MTTSLVCTGPAIDVEAVAGAPCADLPRPSEAGPARAMLPLHLAALLYAHEEIGTREVATSNWGARVSEYLREAGITVPAPWCAAFVYWCARRAAALKGVPLPLEGVALQGYVQSYYLHALKSGWILERSEVGPGDLFLIWFPSLGRYAHIGFVYEMHADHYLTIEGNTDAAGGRDGIEVASRRRQIAASTIFLRWS